MHFIVSCVDHQFPFSVRLTNELIRGNYLAFFVTIDPGCEEKPTKVATGRYALWFPSSFHGPKAVRNKTQPLRFQVCVQQLQRCQVHPRSMILSVSRCYCVRIRHGRGKRERSTSFRDTGHVLLFVFLK